MHLDRLSRRVARAGCATALVLAVSLPAAAEGPATTPLSTCASCDTAALTDADIQTSRQVWHAPGSLPDKPMPVFQGVDMLNLFIVVESGSQHVTVLDGDRFEPLHRFAVQRALQGAPRFSPDGRFAYFLSSEGWVTQFDLWNLQAVAEVRAGQDSRSLAISGNGKYLAVANQRPHKLVLLDAELNLLKAHPALNQQRTRSSPILSVHDAAPRRSFVAVLQDVPEIWEISYNPAADDVPIGMIHDFLYKEGAFIPGFLNPRRSVLPEPMGQVFFTPSHHELLGMSRQGGKSQVIHLDVRKTIASLQLSDMPASGAAATWNYRPAPGTPERSVMALPSPGDGLVRLLDLESWATLKTVPMPGPGRLMRSHEGAPHVWMIQAPTSNGAGALQLLDKHKLEHVASIHTDLGKDLAHVAFSRDGRYALASLRERKADGGAVIVFDTATLKEIKRIPMDGPVGAYNLHNQIARPEP